MKAEVITGDCLEIMPQLGVTVDACLADIPYGTTACSWDSVIPFAPMWANLKRLVKRNGAIVLFGSQPFTSALVMSNPQMFKYQWTWYKNNPTGFQFAKFQPMRASEDIPVFYDEQCAFNPQLMKSRITDRRINVGVFNAKDWSGSSEHIKMPHLGHPWREDVHPWNVLEFAVEPRSLGTLHPTQKPVELMRYLVRTYTNEGDAVLDFTCGSGSTGVACVIENRNFIGIEKDSHYAEVARARIKRAQGVPCDIPRPVRTVKPLPLFGVES